MGEHLNVEQSQVGDVENGGVPQEQQERVTLFEELAEPTEYTAINMSNHTSEKPDYDDQ